MIKILVAYLAFILGCAGFSLTLAATHASLWGMAFFVVALLGFGAWGRLSGQMEARDKIGKELSRLIMDGKNTMRLVPLRERLRMKDLL